MMIVDGSEMDTMDAKKPEVERKWTVFNEGEPGIWGLTRRGSSALERPRVYVNSQGKTIIYLLLRFSLSITADASSTETIL